jgi:exosortase/archaeosortase family protein
MTAPANTRTRDAWLGVLVFGATAFVFLPVSRWLVGEALLREQLRVALAILVAAGGIFVWREWRNLSFDFSWGNRTIVLLGVSYAFVAAAVVAHRGILMIPGALLALASAGVFLLGPARTGLVARVLAGFVAFVALVLAFPLADWPLRQLSGVYAAKLLHAVGAAPQLAVTLDPAPRLVLAVGGRLFEVATECNGFGMIGASALLALMLALATSGSWWRFAAVPVAALGGFTGNVLRILGISLLAPVFPDHYLALHETVGTLALFAALGFAWWLVPAPKPQNGDASCSRGR